MASNLACVGFPVDERSSFEALALRARSLAALLGRAGEIALLRYHDPSGARLFVEVRGRDVVALTPGFAGTTGAVLASLGPTTSGVVVADVVDGYGEKWTAAALDLPEWRFLPPDRDGPFAAAITGFGRRVETFATADDFACSSASLVKRDADPSRFAQRFGAESFVSFGAFRIAKDPAAVDATARFAGTVVSSERRECVLGGAAFVVARVRTLGFEFDLCLSGAEHPDVPRTGSTIAGDVYLSATIPALLPARPTRRRWLRPRS